MRLSPTYAKSCYRQSRFAIEVADVQFLRDHMHMRALSLLILLLVPLADARDKSYATGTFAQVTISDIVVPLKVPPLCQNCSAVEFPVPLGVTYMFEIEQGDIRYVAACTSRAKKSYAADWVIHDSVEYRIDRDKLFLKRPNGKELRLGLVMKVRRTAPQPVSQAASQKPARLMIPDCH